MVAIGAIMAGAGQIVGGVTNVIGNAQQKKLNEQNQRMAIVSGLQQNQQFTQARALAQDQARFEQQKAVAQQKADEKKQKNTLLIAGVAGGFILIAVIIFIATKKQN
ncbi:hypothetical protein [Hugenholtzia roseola]|uniref:hypothetical protein n=1 Tax=Hugenholtzia roseola TaxID=1002 RepID=UPI0004047D42|nr:hypothetical protein [Hugenholtzia roseola]